MHDSPGSVVTQLCSGLQLYSAERRIADCILADVKWASVATSAELAKASHSSEATVTRLCHKLGYANYRKFQLELARDVLEQQEVYKQVFESVRSFDDQEKYLLLRELMAPEMAGMFVTPKDIDQTMEKISYTVSEAINSI